MCTLPVFWNMAYFTMLRNLTFCGTWQKLLPLVAQESLSVIYQMAFFPAHQLRILRPPPHHVLRSLAFNMDMCMACLFDILIIFPWDRQIAIGGAAPSYASYIFNFLGTSTLFSQRLNKYFSLSTLYNGSLFSTATVKLWTVL